MSSTEKERFTDKDSKLSIDMHINDDGICSIKFDGEILVSSENYAGHSWLEIDEKVWDKLNKKLIRK